MCTHRAELRRAGEGLWDVIHNGEQIVAASRNPEAEACRILAARGLTGRAIFVHRHGTIAGGIDIAIGAKLKCAA